MIPLLCEVDDRKRIIMVPGDRDVFPAHMLARFRTLTPRITPHPQSGSDHQHILTMPLSWPAIVQLQGMTGVAYRPGPKLAAWQREQLDSRIAATKPVDTLSFSGWPVGVEPYPWQVTGAAMIAETRRVLITDEPGTGKTATTLLGLREITHRGAKPLPALVVCPASVVDHWVDSARTWAPEWRTIAWRGAPTARHALAGTADIYVASYDTARSDCDGKKRNTLRDIGLRALVIDEAHLIKNPHAARTQAIRRLAADCDTIIALTGTPITHNPADLWTTLVTLDRDAWPSRDRWITHFCATFDGAYGVEIGGLLPHRDAEYRVCLHGQTRRVAKADVLQQLPPKVYSTRTVELPDEWKKVYKSLETNMIAELPDGGELSVMHVLPQLTRLAQLASAAADITTTSDIGDDGIERIQQHVRLRAPSWKVEALLEILDERAGSPVVAFAPSRQLMMLAGELAEKAGHRVGFLVGGQTPAERTRELAAFQAGAYDLLCATTGAGGVGVTLTAARTVVFLQRPWSLVEALQAEDRLHRIGSERHDSIEVIDVLARGTIDTRIRAVLRDKGQQLADILADPRIVREILGGR